MKLLAKFTLVFILVFGAGLGATGYFSSRFLQEQARAEVLQDARLMMETARAARTYTTSQLKPLLEPVQAHDKVFLPQTVPAYAATENFNYLRGRYPDYSYKEATLNPTNPRDRAADWEADVINTFRNHSGQRELIGERDTPTGRSLFLAQPLAVTPPCLECHDRADTSPPAMVRRYGRDNGFGWKQDEVIGAQIVSVPMALPVAIAERAFNSMIVYLAGIFLVSLVLLDLLLLFTVVRPVARLSRMADQISLGNLDAPELPVTAKDEISVLAGSFNRMRRSLVSALKMLDNQ